MIHQTYTTCCNDLYTLNIEIHQHTWLWLLTKSGLVRFITCERLLLADNSIWLWLFVIVCVGVTYYYHKYYSKTNTDQDQACLVELTILSLKFSKSLNIIFEYNLLILMKNTDISYDKICRKYYDNITIINEDNRPTDQKPATDTRTIFQRTKLYAII